MNPNMISKMTRLVSLDDLMLALTPLVPIGLPYAQPPSVPIVSISISILQALIIELTK